jgi:hypothetical protein
VLGGLVVFLIGCLVLCVVLYAANIVLGRINLPADIKQLVLLVIGVIGVIVLVVLAYRAFVGGGPVL